MKKCSTATCDLPGLERSQKFGGAAAKDKEKGRDMKSDRERFRNALEGDKWGTSDD